MNESLDLLQWNNKKILNETGCFLWQRNEFVPVQHSICSINTVNSNSECDRAVRTVLFLKKIKQSSDTRARTQYS